MPGFLVFAAWINDITSIDVQAIELLLNRPEFGNDPYIKVFCTIPISFHCKGYLLQILHPNFLISQTIYAYVLIGWQFLNTSTIIKGVTGLRRRRTLGGLLLISIVALICFVLFAVLYVVGI